MLTFKVLTQTSQWPLGGGDISVPPHNSKNWEDRLWKLATFSVKSGTKLQLISLYLTIKACLTPPFTCLAQFSTQPWSWPSVFHFLFNYRIQWDIPRFLRHWRSSPISTFDSSHPSIFSPQVPSSNTLHASNTEHYNISRRLPASLLSMHWTADAKLLFMLQKSFILCRF